MKNILIMGATSAIAQACARRWAAQGASLLLAGRKAERLEQIAADLRVRGAARVDVAVLDANDLPAQAALVQRCATDFAPLDVALIAHGTLPDQAACERDAALALREFANNATSVIALLTALAPVFEQQRRGVIAVISSVAGDRGRPSNYVYGSAKAAVSAFCEGLRARLFRSGVHLMTIKPGFVDTPMTAGLPLPGPLVAQPDTVAARIVRGVDQRRDVLYTPAFWALIMLIIRSIPGFVFKRLTL